MPEIKEIYADVVVIGGSAAGLPAAVRAREAGAEKVVVLDKTKQLGGCARLAAGMFATDTDTQRSMGIRVSADDCFREHMAVQNWRCDARLVRKWMKGGGPMIRWLEDHGIHFNMVNDFWAYGKGRTVYHKVMDEVGASTGNVTVSQLSKRCDEMGIDVYRKTRANHLLLDENGAICGVMAYNVDNEEEVYKFVTKCVVLGTGSVGANKELIARFMPGEDHSHTKVMSALPHSTGDGLIMAEEIGAASTPAGCLRMGPHNHPNNIRAGLLIRRPEPMTVNKLGERFTDESLYSRNVFSWFAGESLDVQPDKVCYVIYSKKTLDTMVTAAKNCYGLEEDQGRIRGGADMLQDFGGEKGVELEKVGLTAWWGRVMNDVESEVKKGRCKKSDTIRGLAEFIGCDPDTLEDTVKRYNFFCERGFDDDFLKDKEYLYPLYESEGPFYCFEAHQGIDTIIGGIKVDHDLRVLDKTSHPIPGLFAAGVCVGGWLNTGYTFSGACLGFSVWSGFEVGKNAGEYAVSVK